MNNIYILTLPRQYDNVFTALVDTLRKNLKDKALYVIKFDRMLMNITVHTAKKPFMAKNCIV